MLAGAVVTPGVRHLRELAREPRTAGSAGEARARAYAASVLRAHGFRVREEAFDYSRFPGSYGTPVVGAIIGATVGGAALLALAGGHVAPPAAVLIPGLLVALIVARTMLGDGVLHNPLMRSQAVNLVATRGDREPRVWLVAHLDSKSQPIPSAGRVAGVVILSLAVVLALLAQVLTLADLPVRMVWWLALVGTVLGSIPVMFSVVGNQSVGAVDNASGVAAVLVAAQRAGPELAFGVVLPSAEELGLAGVRAWAKKTVPGIALNCDGVDDDGSLVIMHSGKPQTELVRMLERASTERVEVRRMPPGMMTDSTALAEGGWNTVTVSHGSARTLRRVHTRRDSLLEMTGGAIEIVATLLLTVLEILA